MFDILKSRASAFMSIELHGSSKIKKQKKYEDGTVAAAAAAGGSTDAFVAYRKLFPKGYDEELTAFTKAYNEVSSHFRKNTIRYGMGAASDEPETENNTKGKEARAAGKRAIATSLAISGKFENEHNALIAKLNNERTRFANSINRIVSKIQYDNALGSSFDPEDYPTKEEIESTGVYRLIGPDPFPEAANLEGLPATKDWIDNVTNRMRREAEAEVKFAQQELANDLLKYVAKVAERTKALEEWNKLPLADRPRKPGIAETVTANLEATINKIRTFAVPETEEGAKLLEAAAKVEEILDVGGIQAEDLRQDVQMTSRVSKDSQALVEALKGMDIVGFDATDFGAPM